MLQHKRVLIVIILVMAFSVLVQASVFTTVVTASSYVYKETTAGGAGTYGAGGYTQIKAQQWWPESGSGHDYVGWAKFMLAGFPSYLGVDSAHIIYHVMDSQGSSPPQIGFPQNEFDPSNHTAQYIYNHIAHSGQNPGEPLGFHDITTNGWDSVTVTDITMPPIAAGAFLSFGWEVDRDFQQPVEDVGVVVSGSGSTNKDTLKIFYH